MSLPFFTRHEELLSAAVDAIAKRGYWSAYPEMPSPKVYGENAAEMGRQAFEARRNAPFVLGQEGTVASTGNESSPFGFPLGITYPRSDLDALFMAIEKARSQWRKAGAKAWAGVCLEILHRLNQRSFEMANAVMHTTGQAFMMAFQAGAAHAQDRGLEAVAYVWKELSQIPAIAYWEKPQGKADPLRMEKRYAIVPRGIGLVIGCCTFPTWNSYPGFFASLASGNAVVVKPHPGAILPLAITVDVAREVLREGGFDPNIVTLVAHESGDPIVQALALRPEIKLIDFTGSTANGVWLERNAHQASVYTEKAGVNQIVIDSIDDIKNMSRNIAFSISLYSGQMCTKPQNIYVPRDGIETAAGHVSFDQVAESIGEAIDKLVSDPVRAVEILGAIQNDAIAERIDQARSLGTVVRDSMSLVHPQFPNARVRTPLLLKLPRAEDATVMREWFGPIAMVVATESTNHSIELARRGAHVYGALTLAAYSTRPEVLEKIRDAAEDAGVAVSFNLTGGVFVNQSAAFSDFHATGANPAANASLTDSAFVANRFRVVQSRIHV